MLHVNSFGIYSAFIAVLCTKFCMTINQICMILCMAKTPPPKAQGEHTQTPYPDDAWLVQRESE